MNRHLSLLADLHEHELAHADVVLFGDRASRIEIDLIGGKCLEQVLECQVVI